MMPLYSEWLLLSCSFRKCIDIAEGRVRHTSLVGLNPPEKYWSNGIISSGTGKKHLKPPPSPALSINKHIGFNPGCHLTSKLS